MWFVRKKQTLKPVEVLRGVVRQATENERASDEGAFQKRRKRYFGRVVKCIATRMQEGGDCCYIRSAGLRGEITVGNTVYFNHKFIKPFYNYYKDDFLKAGYAFYFPDYDKESVFICWIDLMTNQH